jgi:hypothetical protein
VRQAEIYGPSHRLLGRGGEGQRCGELLITALRAADLAAPADWRIGGRGAQERVICMARRVWARRDESSAAGLLRRMLNLDAIAVPPYRVAFRQVVVVGREPGCSVDQLADDVGVVGVPAGFGEHVHQDAVSVTSRCSGGHQGNWPVASSPSGRTSADMGWFLAFGAGTSPAPPALDTIRQSFVASLLVTHGTCHTAATRLTARPSQP